MAAPDENPKPPSRQVHFYSIYYRDILLLTPSKVLNTVVRMQTLQLWVFPIPGA